MVRHDSNGRTRVSTPTKKSAAQKAGYRKVIRTDLTAIRTSSEGGTSPRMERRCYLYDGCATATLVR
jgi:hypothetical protein